MTDPYAPLARWTPDGLVPASAEDPHGQQPPHPGQTVDPADLPAEEPVEEHQVAPVESDGTGHEEQQLAGPDGESIPKLPHRDDKKEAWIAAGQARGVDVGTLQRLTKPEIMELLRNAKHEQA